MAVFNPDVKGYNEEPNYMRYSRGGAQGDKGPETALKGVSTVGGQAANLFDESVKRSINEQVAGSTKEADENRLGHPTDTSASDIIYAPDAKPAVDPAASSKGLLPVSAPSGEAPPEAVTKELPKTLQRYTAARDSGRWSDSQYWSFLDAEASKYKARYPGYSDIIDASMKSATGHVPADMMIQAKFKEVSDANKEKDDIDKTLLTYVNHNPQAVQPDWWERYAAGKPYSAIETYAFGGHYLTEEKRTQEARNAILFKQSQRKDVQEDLELAHAQEVNSFTTRMLQSMTGPNGDLLRKFMADPASAVEWTPKEKESLAMAMQSFKTQWRDSWEKQEQAPWGGDPTKSWYSQLPTDKREKNIKSAEERIKLWEDMIGDKKWNLLESSSRLLKRTQEANASKVYDSNDIFRLTKAFHDIGLPDAAQHLEGEKGFQSAVGEVRHMELLTTAAKGGSTSSLGTEVKAAADKDRKERDKGVVGSPVPGQDYETSLKMYTRTIADKATPPAALKNMVDFAYKDSGENFLNLFKSGYDREKVYSVMVSPEVTAKIAELGKTDPQVWDKYKSFALSGFKGLYQGTLADVKEASNSIAANITFDPKSNQFVYSFSSPRDREAMGGKIPVVDTINKQLKVLEPVLKHDGSSAGDIISQALDQWGMTPEAYPKGTLPEKLYMAIHNFSSAFASDIKEGVSGTKGQFKRQDIQPTGDPAWAGLKEGLANARDIDKNAYRPESAMSNGISLSSDPGAPQQRHYGLLRAIQGAETGGRYGAVYGDPRDYNLNEHTLSEVQGLQRMRKNAGYASTAVGGYQFLQKTVKGLTEAMGLTGDEKFTPELQDRMAYALLHSRGLADYESGRITDKEFAHRLAQEFAGLPTEGGYSYYHKDGLNKSQVTYKELLDAIRSTKEKSK